MARPAGAFGLVVGVAAVACVTSPTPVLAPGAWGGEHVSIEVTSAGARLEYDCADGLIGAPLRPDGDGRFTAAGTHTPGRGGPIRLGEILPTFGARYEGRVDGERMSLQVTLTDTGVVVGTFELRRGSSGRLVRCL